MDTKSQRLPFVVRSDDGTPIWYLGGVATVKATEQETGMCSVLVETFPAGFASGLHNHETEDKCFYVLQGEMRVRCGDLDALAGEGAFVFLPRGVAHAFKVGDDGPATWLNIQATGDFRRLIEETGVPAPAHRLPKPEEAHRDPRAFASAARNHHLELLGPPPFESGTRPAG